VSAWGCPTDGPRPLANETRRGAVWPTEGFGVPSTGSHTRGSRTSCEAETLLSYLEQFSFHAGRHLMELQIIPVESIIYGKYIGRGKGFGKALRR
jgi:hypothetical protein